MELLLSKLVRSEIPSGAGGGWGHRAVPGLSRNISWPAFAVTFPLAFNNWQNHGSLRFSGNYRRVSRRSRPHATSHADPSKSLSDWWRRET